MPLFTSAFAAIPDSDSMSEIEAKSAQPLSPLRGTAFPLLMLN